MIYLTFMASKRSFYFSGVCFYFAVFDISESLDKLPGGKFLTIHTFYILLSIVFLFVIINSSNTIDGIDLLCITYFIVNFAAMSFLFTDSMILRASECARLSLF